MSTSAQRTDDAAASWAIRRTRGLTEAETREFLLWLERDPGHRSALAIAEHAVGLMRKPRDAGELREIRAQLRSRAEGRRRRLKRIILGGVSAVTAAAAAFAILVAPPMRAPQEPTTAKVATVEIRPDRRVLPDGSEIMLNAGAEVRIAYSADRRAIELVRGQAMFSVMKDPARPFVVTASGIEVRAIGTTFLVQHSQATVDVLVTEGRVAVGRAEVEPPAVDSSGTATPESDEPLFVAAGARVTVPLSPEAAVAAVAAVAVQPTTPAEIDAALAWREKRVEFTATPLGEAVAMLNRENTTQLVIVDKALAERRLSGIFWKDDPAAFASLIEMSFGARIEKIADHRILVDTR